MPPLPGRSSQVGERRRLAVLGAGGGPVGLEQLALDALERRRHLGLAERRELAGQEAGAAQALVERDVPVLAVGLVGVGVAVLAGVAQPVGQRLGEVGPAHRAGLADQELLGLRERARDVGRVQHREPPGVGERDVARGERRHRGGHRAQSAGEADIGSGVVEGGVVGVGQPRARRPEALGGPVAAGVDGVDQARLDRGQTGSHPAELDERVGHGAVVQLGDVDRDQVVDHRVERLHDRSVDETEHVFDDSSPHGPSQGISGTFGCFQNPGLQQGFWLRRSSPPWAVARAPRPPRSPPRRPAGGPARRGGATPPGAPNERGQRQHPAHDRQRPEDPRRQVRVAALDDHAVHAPRRPEADLDEAGGGGHQPHDQHGTQAAPPDREAGPARRRGPRPEHPATSDPERRASSGHRPAHDRQPGRRPTAPGSCSCTRRPRRSRAATTRS